MKEHRLRIATEIPLYLLPLAIAHKVREWGNALHRISVKRTHLHHFNVTVRTKPVPKELSEEDAATNPDAESAAGEKPAATRRRRCFA